MAKKEKKEPEKPSTAWQGTYGDMITLMLCFFVMMYDPSETDAIQMAALTASIQGDPTAGGASMASGRLADLGNTISSMPALEKGRVLGLAAKRAVSLFAPEIKTNKITISSDERGLVITLASDSYFKRGSAELNIESVRSTLQNLAAFLSSSELLLDQDGNIRKFRIEGHTDSSDEYKGKYPSNWELSTARATNVLHYLSDFGADESRFSVAGYADTQPKYSDNSEEGRAYNRRVDIIILDEGHF
ncbi:MAG: flagellar motor protein MotB [Treponemataceae bacterium]|nr:flagellar motor protein MotB [Treponemataceae bacterium]